MCYAKRRVFLVCAARGAAHHTAKHDIPSSTPDSVKQERQTHIGTIPEARGFYVILLEKNPTTPISTVMAIDSCATLCYLCGKRGNCTSFSMRSLRAEASLSRRSFSVRNVCTTTSLVSGRRWSFSTSVFNDITRSAILTRSASRVSLCTTSQRYNSSGEAGMSGRCIVCAIPL